MLPNLLIIGAPKCGTTTLHEWLVQHPDVVGGTRKEAQYLVDRTSSTFRPDSNYHLHGMTGYAALFGEARVVLDATPGYLYQRTALEVLGGELTVALMIVVVRDPVERFLSAHRYYSHAHPVLPPHVGSDELFERCRQQDRTLPDNEFVRGALSHGEYSRYLDEWAERCGRERLMVISTDDLERRPQLTLARIADWVGIDRDEFPGAETLARRNVGYTVRYHRLHRLVARHRSRLPDGRLRATARRAYRALNVTSPDRTDSGRPELLQALAQHYEEWNQNVADRYGIDTSGWTRPRSEP